MEGWLIKLAGAVFKTWEERYFILKKDGSNCTLSYFRNKNELNVPRNCWNLKGCQIHRAAEGKIDAPSAFCMELMIPLDNKLKSYLMCCENEIDLEKWMYAINEGIAIANGDNQAAEKYANLFNTVNEFAAKSKMSPLRTRNDIQPNNNRTNASSSNNNNTTPDITNDMHDPTCISSWEQYATNVTEADENALVVLAKLVPKPPDLLSSPHRLLKTGGLLEYDPLKGKSVERHTILLNDVLLLTAKARDGTFSLKIHMSLSVNPTIEASADSQTEFQLVTPTCNRSFILFAKSQKDRDEWVAAIKGAVIATCKNAWTPPSSTERLDESGSQFFEVDEGRL